MLFGGAASRCGPHLCRSGRQRTAGWHCAWLPSLRWSAQGSSQSQSCSNFSRETMSKNVKIALLLALIALTTFLGIIAKYWLLSG